MKIYDENTAQEVTITKNTEYLAALLYKELEKDNWDSISPEDFNNVGKGNYCNDDVNTLAITLEKVLREYEKNAFKFLRSGSWEVIDERS